MLQPFRMPAGAVLFRPGDECPGFVMLDAGVIRVTLTSASGREIVLYRVRPGEVCLQTFGCLVEGRRYAAEGVAETDLCGQLAAPGAFRRAMAEDPAFRDRLMAAVARRFQDFEEVVETLAFAGLEQRVASALLRLSEADGLVHATHGEIAIEIGSAREAVSRQIGALAREGLVEAGRGQVRILDRDRLSQLVEAPMGRAV